MGFFAPNNGDSALACLEMMDFDGLDKIKENVRNNAILYQQVMQLTQALITFAPEAAAQLGIVPPEMQQIANQPTGNASTSDKSRGSLSAQAANATRESTTVRS